MSAPETNCPCVIDADGILENVCKDHVTAMWEFEYRMRRVLDHELDEAVKELAGRSPTRIERKVGATGTFDVARKAP